MIQSLYRNPHVRRFAISFLVVELVALMTGPPGSTEAPTSGFQGSYFEDSSFYGLFRTQRWIVFFTLAVVLFVLWSSWLAKGVAVRATTSKLLAVPRSITQRKPVRWGFMAAALAVALLLPRIVNDAFWHSAMTEQIGVFVLLATGLNVVVGFAGLLDLGYVAFYAIGAYTTAWMTGSLPMPAPFHGHYDPFVAIPVAILIVMIAGILLGAPTLRLRGDYLAIVTLGFGEIVTIFANNLYGITGGSQGSGPIPHPVLHLGPLHYVWSLKPVPYYYLLLVFLVIFLIAFTLLEHSRIGRAWTAIREDEVAAESVGINPLKYKVMAFAIGASTAGFAGVVTASQSNSIFPSSFTLQSSINILVLVIFGGMGSIFGVVVGAIIIQVAYSYLLHTPPQGYQPADLYMYLGALLIVMMIFRPVGLIPSKRRKREIKLSEAGEGHMDEVLTGDTL
ncbi:MAG TPA: branched-chain amino acid ABC transporter permease [Acidimicrobiales bacterium]|nr:branched-chain amino acid ABC transporter permease [Acidimicrobiales bacterium]